MRVESAPCNYARSVGAPRGNAPAPRLPPQISAAARRLSGAGCGSVLRARRAATAGTRAGQGGRHPRARVTAGLIAERQARAPLPARPRVPRPPPPAASPLRPQMALGLRVPSPQPEPCPGWCHGPSDPVCLGVTVLAAMSGSLGARWLLRRVPCTCPAGGAWLPSCPAGTFGCSQHGVGAWLPCPEVPSSRMSLHFQGEALHGPVAQEDAAAQPEPGPPTPGGPRRRPAVPQPCPGTRPFVPTRCPLSRTQRPRPY